MDLFYLKLTLAPFLVAGATLAGRRYGDRAAGLVAGLPIVAGPILFFFALEQGTPYAVHAGLATLLGVISLCLFVLGYAWRAWMGGTALSSLLLGWALFGLGTVLIQRALLQGAPGLGRSLFYALLALFLTHRSLPSLPEPAARPAPGPWDLPLRMAAAATLVLLLTQLARSLGPALGGLLTPFPVASTVLAVFAHRQGSSGAAVAVLKGLLLALGAFAAFCAVLVLALPRFSLPLGFGLAVAAALAVQGLALAWTRRASPKPAPAP